MEDRMIFPDNPFDFIKQYEFRDTEKVYTDGDRLIPSFRVETLITYYKQQLINDIIAELKVMERAPKVPTSWNNGWSTALKIAIEDIKKKGAQ